MKNTNKMYIAPEAEAIRFAKEDVITASPLDWELPTIDIGGNNWFWSEDGSEFTFKSDT